MENNLLSISKYQRLDDLAAKLSRQGRLTDKELDEANSLLSEDKAIDTLLKRNQSNPEALSLAEKHYLASKVNEIAIERAKQNRSLITDEKTATYNWNYDYPQLGNDYGNLKKELNAYTGYKESFNYQVANSTAEAGGLLLGLPGVTGVAEVISTAPKIGALAMKYPAVTEGVIAGGINAGYQKIQNDKIDYYSVGGSIISSGLTRNMSPN